MSESRFEIVQTDAGYTARFVAASGDIIMSSGGQVYADRRDAERAIELVWSASWKAPTVDVDERKPEYTDGMGSE